ncbi:MAG: hypothetical protein SH850_05600 [Planctomycetaceae bacterium]|nr:hypothetical protein [Planctomycetaceae bacterium]
MYRRGILAAVVAAIVFASGSTCSAGPVLPGGPLQGDWSCTCTSLIRITVPPFTTTTFHITQIGSVIQGVNAPTGSDPLCALAGTYSSGVIMANTTCGAPRNTTGYLVGTLAADGLSFDTLWLDSQGLYRIRGTKLP